MPHVSGLLFELKHLIPARVTELAEAPLDHESRKAEHLRVCLEEDVRAAGISSGFERFRFVHQALPEMDLSDVDLSTGFLDHDLAAPILISSMTGGTAEAGRINTNLARAAQELGLAMGVGSQRAAIESASLAESYQVRDVAPDILLFANLGAVQLNRGYGAEECARAIEMIDAQALVLHLNPLQECLQAGGDVQFGGLLDRIGRICHEVPFPVIVKEVGWGISAELAGQLAEAGVAAIDVAGAGGTSWSEVEGKRTMEEGRRQIARAFRDWGIPTAQCLQDVRKALPEHPVIASGGIGTGVEAAKALALGADLVGMAGGLLEAAAESGDQTIAVLKGVLTQLRIAMFCCGVGDLNALRQTPALVEVAGR
jgi:isopentenyl-diphosphate delta-isomerase